jgi:hypothetical protein
MTNTEMDKTTKEIVKNFNECVNMSLSAVDEKLRNALVPKSTQLLVNTSNIPIQHPIGEILKKKIELPKPIFTFPPITSLIKPISSYTSSYTLLGGLLGFGYGFYLMKLASRRKFITYDWEVQENQGYIFWGGILGLCFGNITGKLISIM